MNPNISSLESISTFDCFFLKDLFGKKVSVYERYSRTVIVGDGNEFNDFRHPKLRI